MNRLTYKLADLGLAMMNDAIKQFRVSSSLSKDYPKKLKLPSIYGISPSFLPFPRDYPQDSQFTGFWYGRSNDELPADVTNFLSTKKKSVLLTFGSMPFETKLNLSEALRDLSKRLDINVIIVRGWGFGKASGIDEESVKMIPSAPYEKLIPKVDAVLFHGGIGTMAECLRAGVPFLACPVIYPMGDQHFWGKRAHDLGCAPKPLPLKKLTSDLLISNVSDLLSSPRYNASCKRMSKALADEDGLTTAVDFVESKIIQAK